MVVPEVMRFVSTEEESPDSEMYSLPGYGFITPEFAKMALPNCFRDLTSLLKSRKPNKWINLEELQAT